MAEAFWHLKLDTVDLVVHYWTVGLLMFGILHEHVLKQFLAHKEEAKSLFFKSREDWHCWANRML